jgi:glycerate 2-kinase
VKVVVAPDSFKGTLGAGEVADHLIAGWSAERPHDVTVRLPMADGGEGSLQLVAGCVPDAEVVPVPGVTGPDGVPRCAEFLLLPDGTAFVELARSSGLPLMPVPAPLTATSRGVGDVIAAALQRRPTRLVVAVGGSASTDGGAGLLAALGARLTDDRGAALPDGGAALGRLGAVDLGRLPHAPPGGIVVLTDVRNPLLGLSGAAAAFGPQKGAGPEEVALLERGLRRWAAVLGGDADAPGAGAAGGTAFGLASAFPGTTLTGGAAHLAELVGLGRHMADADLVITGEGRVDVTTASGKVCGEVLARADRTGTPVAVVAGSVAVDSPLADAAEVVSLAELGGSIAAAMSRPHEFLRVAGRRLARAAAGPLSLHQPSTGTTDWSRPVCRN